MGQCYWRCYQDSPLDGCCECPRRSHPSRHHCLEFRVKSRFVGQPTNLCLEPQLCGRDRNANQHDTCSAAAWMFLASFDARVSVLSPVLTPAEQVVRCRSHLLVAMALRGRPVPKMKHGISHLFYGNKNTTDRAQ